MARSPLTRSNLGFLLSKASQLWNESLHAAFTEAGYPEVRPSFGSVLVVLFEQDGLRITEIAERSGLSKQTLTTLLRSVEQAGMIAREEDPDDKRANRVRLTRKANEFRPVAERVLAELEHEAASVGSSDASRTTAAWLAAYVNTQRGPKD